MSPASATLILSPRCPLKALIGLCVRGRVSPETGETGMLLPAAMWDSGSKGRPSSLPVSRLATGWDRSLFQVALVWMKHVL